MKNSNLATKNSSPKYPRKKFKRTKKLQSYHLGISAELGAIIFLRLKGYKILARRYKTSVGEIDIIAHKRDFLVAVEVKARKGDFLAEELVSYPQKQRIKRTINAFVGLNFDQYQNSTIRFDLIIIRPYRWPLHFLGFWD